MSSGAVFHHAEGLLSAIAPDLAAKIRHYLDISEERVPSSVWIDLLVQLGDSEGVLRYDPTGQIRERLTAAQASTFKDWWGEIPGKVQLSLFH